MIFDYATGGGSLHWIISNLLSWETDEQACSAVKMGRGDTNTNLPHGTFAFLWPTFLILCGSCFVETLACALQGRAVKTETGMTLFEHSLAFAEAESMISKSIGLNMFGLPKQNPISQSASGESGTSPLYLLTRAQVLDRMNITPELLLIVVISCCNTLSYHVLDVLGKQNRYRLINTAFWGVLFMAAMCWGLEAGPPVSLDTGVLRFPTVCIVGFIPHMLILFGIIVCFAIYGLALTITAFSLPTEDDGQTLSLRERFFLAHANMQGSQQIQNIRANRHEDFYTTLLRIGYVALTAASEAVFLNEGKAVIARQMTWLEQDRLAEIQASRERSSYGNFSRQDAGGTSFDAHAFTTFDLPDNGSTWESGYNREKTIEKPQGSRALRSQVELGGVGAVQSSIRLRHGISFFRAIFALIARWMAFGFCRVLDRLGISRRPQWLKRLAGSRNSQAPNTSSTHPSNDFWILNDEGDLEVPANGEFDVEYEMRKRDGEYTRETSQGPDENRIDDKLYGWWKSGGSWGNQDYTPDYNPPIDNDDITSVISMATNASQSDWEDCNSDGRRTPTQSNPHPMYSRESSPLQEQSMDVSMLARLLDPRDRETREEARILAAHLKSGQGGRILTRSQYQKQMERDRSRVLLSSRLSDVIDRPVSGNCKPTAEEEAELLEKLILSRRSETVPMPDDNTSWESGASGLGPNGPPCVVCQTNPRSVITWPCRCLCVCEDCRVSLAMNNFGSCVTCRQDVNGFMRLWVP